MSRNLPKFPNLDHLKKQAKALLRELQQHNPETKLSQAQHKIALEYGFASWPKLKAHIAASQGAVGSGGGITAPPVDAQNDSGGGGLFPRFAEKARRTIFFARYMAVREDKQIEAVHLLRGTLQADPDLMNRFLPGHFQPLPAPGPEELAQLKTSLVERNSTRAPLSMECRRVLEHAAKEADRLQHQRISAGHFLLGFLCDEIAQTTPILMEILREKGIRLDVARNQVEGFLSEEHW